MAQRKIFFLIIGCFLAFPLWGTDVVRIMPVRTTINPIIAELIQKELKSAREDGVKALILELDTPGGSLESTREIIQEMLGSPLLVVVYISPQGARGASAGFFLLTAADLALMAEETHSGSATPVMLGEKGEEKMSQEMKNKIMEDTLAFLRNLSSRNKRPWKAVEAAVISGKSYTAKEALQIKLIDGIVDSRPALSEYLERQRVFTKNGQVIELKNIQFEEREIPWHKKLLLFLANPSLVYILLSLGMLGLIFEFYSPGIGFPGIFGFICLMLAFAGLSLFPVSYVGVALMLLGIILLIMEMQIVSYGLLTVGGLFSLGLGSFLFFDKNPVSFTFLGGTLIGFVLVAVVFVVWMLRKIVPLRKKESMSEVQSHGEALVLEDFVDKRGPVRFKGEIWQAIGARDHKKGEQVSVEGREGLALELAREK